MPAGALAKFCKGSRQQDLLSLHHIKPNKYPSLASQPDLYESISLCFFVSCPTASSRGRRCLVRICFQHIYQCAKLNRTKPHRGYTVTSCRSIRKWQFAFLNLKSSDKKKVHLFFESFTVLLRYGNIFQMSEYGHTSVK